MNTIINPPPQKNTRERILEAASELFIINGFAATSVDEIIDKVSIAKGTFYHHFISKEALLESVTDNLSRSGLNEILERMNEAKVTNPIARLNAMFRISMEWREENIESMMYLVNALCKETNISFKYTLRKKGKELSIPILEDILKQGKKDNIFKIDNPRIVSDMILSLLDGLSDDLEKDLMGTLEVSLHKVIQEYQIAIEKILCLEPNSIRLIDWNSYQSIKKKIQNFYEK